MKKQPKREPKGRKEAYPDVRKKDHAETPPEVREDKPNRAEFHHGSTTQGGSDYGQGSSELGKEPNRQGSESNDGANYANERGWNNEALRREDLDDADGAPGK